MKTLKAKVLVLMMCLASPLGMAGSDVDWESVLEDAVTQGVSSYDATIICDGDSTCESEISDPSVSDYYTNSTDTDTISSSDSALTEAGQEAFDDSDMADEIQEREDNAETPDFTDETHAVLDAYIQDIASNDGELCATNSLGGGTSTSTVQCYEDTGNPVSCTLTLGQSDTETEEQTYSKAVSYSLSTDSEFVSGKGYKYTITFSFPESNEITIHSLTLQNACTGYTRRRVYVSNGGEYRYIYTYLVDQITIGGQTLVGGVKNSDGEYESQSVTASFDDIKIANGKWVGTFYSADPDCTSHQFIINYTATVPKLVWTNSCNTTTLSQYNCSVESTECSEDGDTRTVGGIEYTTSCWEKVQSWSCPQTDTCSDLSTTDKAVEELEAGETSCTATTKTCSTSVNGVCLQTLNTESCTTKLPDSVELDCDSDLTCDEGDTSEECQTADYTSSTDMATAITKLEVLTSIGDNFDSDSLTFFSADAMKCSKAVLGVKDCCGSESGWATDVGLASCTTEEKDLAIAKSKDLAIKVGTYCSEKTALGVCLSKKTSYCVYTGQIAKLFMVGAISQLGLSLGSAKSPDCSGLTEDEFTSVDFEAIDFSDYTDTITITSPDLDDISSSVSDQVSSSDYSNASE